jgi:hypothetical protein
MAVWVALGEFLLAGHRRGGCIMAKRQTSDSLHRGTFPGTGRDATASSDGLSGIHPVEQMVDAAIDRLAREAQRERGATTPATTAAGLRDLRPVLQSQRSRGGALARPARLHWKGYDVSDEFRRYAERIASGEELPPFRGRVLQRPHPTFPWSPGRALQNARRGSALHVALWCSAGLVTLAIAWAVTQRVEAGADGSNAAASFALEPAPPPPVETAARLPRVAPVPDDVLALDELADPGETAEGSEDVALEAVALDAAEPPEPSPAIVAARPTPRAVPARAPASAPAPVPAPAPTTAAAPPPVETAGPAAQAADPGLQALAEDLEELIPAGAPPAPVATPAETEGLEELLPPEPPAADVRKKPSRESSTNGALLIETPSF